MSQKNIDCMNLLPCGNQADAFHELEGRYFFFIPGEYGSITRQVQRMETKNRLKSMRVFDGASTVDSFWQ